MITYYVRHGTCYRHRGLRSSTGPRTHRASSSYIQGMSLEARPESTGDDRKSPISSAHVVLIYLVGLRRSLARPYCPHVPPRRVPRSAGRGPPIPEPAGSGLATVQAKADAHTKRVARGGAAAVRLRQTDRRHPCRNVLAQAWYHGRARSECTRFPSTVLPPYPRRCS